VATTLLVAGPTLTLQIPGQTLFASVNLYSSLFKGCLYNRVSHGRHFIAHNITIRVSSACEDHCMTAITMMWTEPLWAFPESYTVGMGARAMVDNGETKGS